MSAPTCRDPLTVTTTDGTRWTRRAVTREGRGLYVLAGTPRCCPEHVMATLEELAEHGIRGRDQLADAVALLGALPMPVSGSLLEENQRLNHDLDGAILSLFEEEQSLERARRAARLARGRAARLRKEAKRLRSRVAELEAERRSTNEALSDALVELRAAQDRIGELEAAAAQSRTETIADVGDWLDEVGEKNAAHLVYTSDIPAARDMRSVPVSVSPDVVQSADGTVIASSGAVIETAARPWSQSAFQEANDHIRGTDCQVCSPSNLLPQQCPEGQRLTLTALGKGPAAPEATP